MGCLSVYPFGGVQPEGWVWLSHHQLHVGTGRKPLTTGGSPMVGSPDPCPFTSPTPLPLLDQMDGLCLSFMSGLFALGSQLYHAQKNQQRPGLTPNTRFTLSPHFPAGVQSPDFLHAPPPAQSSEGSLSGLAHSTRSPHPTWLLNLPRLTYKWKGRGGHLRSGPGDWVSEFGHLETSPQPASTAYN